MASESVAYPSRRELRAASARHARPRRHPVRAYGRARHASPAGEGFGRLVALTTLGAFVPGSGLVAGGARRVGWTVVGLFVLGIAALGGLVLGGGITSLGLRVATRPSALLLVAATIAVVAVVWCAVILVGHVLLRRDRLTGPQRVLSALLVAALMGMIAVPSATAARYAMAQRSLILTVFDEDETDREGLASPDLAAEDPWEDHPRVNVLLLGSDAGSGRTGTRTDSMIVASIDTSSGDTVLFSLPRNLEGPRFTEGSPGAQRFPSGFYPSGVGNCAENDCHINGVWTWAESSDVYAGSPDPGLNATRDVIGGTLGLQLDYYAIVNLRGFEDLVDAIGGVEMTVERRIPIGGGTNQVTGRKNPITGYIEPGRQVLDGRHALWYARSREGSDDYDRMARQRCVLAAVRSQAEPARLARAFPALAASAERNIFTDIRGSELEAFIELGLRVQKGSMRSLSFDRSVITPEDADYDEIRRLVAEAIEPPEPAPAPTASAPSTDATATPDPTPEATADEPEQEPAPDEVDPDQAVDVRDVCG